MITSGTNTTTWNYSASGWLTGKRDHADKGADYTWTNGGKLQSREWQRVISGTSTRVKTTWNYHAHTGEWASVDHNDSTPDLVYSFDRLGRSSQITQAGHSWVYAYDASTLRLDTETINYDTDGNGTADFTRVLDRSQDSLGRNNGWALKNGGTTQHSNTYTFDAAGRLATVIDGTDTFTYSYVANSSDLIGTVTSPNPGSPVRKVTNTWASNRDVLTVKQNQRSVSGTLVTASQYTYTVDNLPRRTDVSFSGDAFSASGSVAWAYNTSGEVQSANHSINTSDRYFLYDTLGNRIRARDGVTADSGGTLTSYTTNTLNQYSALSGAVSVSPTYDLDGNQLTGVLPVNPGIASGYTWNANNELIEVKSGNPLTTLAIYNYDPFGRRIMRDAGGGKTWFFYDGWNLIAEHNNSGSLQRAHTWGLDVSGSFQGAGGVGGLLCSRILGTGFYPFYDSNGNITEYVNASGTISAHYEYDPFGRFTASGSSHSTFNFRFSSKYYDTQTGLSYYGFRYYDPLGGRWTNRDPIGERGGIALYGFVDNATPNKTDRLGLASRHYMASDINTEHPERYEYISGGISVSTNIDISDCKCKIPSAAAGYVPCGPGTEKCTGSVVITVQFQWRGMGEHMDNTHGNGPGKNKSEELLGDGLDTPGSFGVSGGDFVNGTDMEWDGEVDAEGNRKGKNSTMTTSITHTVPCTGGTAKGKMYIASGLKTSASYKPLDGRQNPRRGLLFYEVDYEVEIEECGITKTDKVGAQVGPNHPARSGSGLHKPLQQLPAPLLSSGQ